MAIKFWLDDNGNEIRGAAGEWHQKAARTHLRSKGITPKDTDKDLYAQMFHLGCMRIVVEGNTVWADNDNKMPEGTQRDWLLAQQFHGMNVQLNNRLFESTRDGQANAGHSMKDIS
jgi:hypothetical protein